MQKKALVGMIFVLVALIMIALSLMMPWYMIEDEHTANGAGYTNKMEYYLDHITLSSGTSNVSIEVSYDEEGAQDQEFVKTFQTTQLFVYLGIIGCIIGMIGAALVMVGKVSHKAGAVMVLLAVILSLIAPMYLMFSLPAAFKEDYEDPEIKETIGKDFFGSTEHTEDYGFINETVKSSWGGTTGWFLGIIAMVMCIIALVLVAKAKPAAEPAPPAEPATFTIEPAPQAMTMEPEAPVTFQPEGAPIQPPPPVQPPDESQGEQFQCPQCAKIFILSTPQRPAILNCPYCGLEGLVD